MAPLDEYIANDADLYPEGFIPVLYNTYGHWDEQQWALPYHADVFLLYYCKDLFEDPAMQAAFLE